MLRRLLDDVFDCLRQGLGVLTGLQQHQIYSVPEQNRESAIKRHTPDVQGRQNVRARCVVQHCCTASGLAEAFWRRNQCIRQCGCAGRFCRDRAERAGPRSDLRTIGQIRYPDQTENRRTTIPRHWRKWRRSIRRNRPSNRRLSYDPRSNAPALAEPFGLNAEPVMAGEILTKWNGVEADIRAENDILELCRTSPERCPAAARSFLAIVAQGRLQTGRARIGIINRAINLAIRPMSDLAQWGCSTAGAPHSDAHHRPRRLRGLCNRQIRRIISRQALRRRM